MIRREMRLYPLPVRAVVYRHDARIVDQYINAISMRPNRCSRGAHRGEVIQLDGDEERLCRWADGLDLVDDGLDFGCGTGEQDELFGMAAGEGEGRVGA